MNSTLLFYQYLCWKSIQGKTSSTNSFFHSEHNEHDLIKCAIANTIWSSADAARSDQVRHQVLDTIWSWRSHQVQTQPDLIKQPAEHDLIRKRVQWTRLPYKENEFVELIFLVYFFFHNEHNKHDLIKCAIANTIWSSADAAIKCRRSPIWSSAPSSARHDLILMQPSSADAAWSDQATRWAWSD